MDDDEFGEVPDFSTVLEPTVSRTASSPQTPAPKASPTKPVEQPKPQVLPNRGSRSAILVSARQKGNPILNHVRLLPWEYADIPADYVLGATTCALFLSLKYHRLHPEYVYSRIKQLGGKYALRILLIMVDIPNHEDSLKELSKTSIVNNLTLILCWSAAEAGHYLELFKSSENAAPTAIRSQQAQSYKDSLVDIITTPRSINKSDAASLISTFGSLQAAMNAQPEQISAVPGWGERKVSQWTDAVKEDFKTRAATRRTVAPPKKQNEFMNPNTRIPPASNEELMVELFDDSLDEAASATSNTVQGAPNQTEQVDEGIMAALAKLRKENA